MENDLLKELQLRIDALIEKHVETKDKLLVLERDNEDLRSKLNESYQEITHLKNKNKEFKIVNGLMGNMEHKRLMKLKLNNLIKEIDICVAGLKHKNI